MDRTAGIVKRELPQSGSRPIPTSVEKSPKQGEVFQLPRKSRLKEFSIRKRLSTQYFNPFLYFISTPSAALPHVRAGILDRPRSEK
jgi:hypothetical protein